MRSFLSRQSTDDYDHAIPADVQHDAIFASRHGQIVSCRGEIGFVAPFPAKRHRLRRKNTEVSFGKTVKPSFDNHCSAGGDISAGGNLQLRKRPVCSDRNGDRAAFGNLQRTFKRTAAGNEFRGKGSSPASANVAPVSTKRLVADGAP